MLKIIDNQGRLFGKINIIDFIVLIFLLCLTPMFYFGYKIFIKKPPPLIQKTAKQLYEEKIAQLTQEQEEMEYEKKLMQLKQNIAIKDIDLEDLLKGYKIILIPDGTR